MIHAVKSVRTLQAVAMTVGLALFLWSTGLPALFRSAEAASISSASDTLSSSAPGLVSNHTIQFTTPNGIIAGQTIELTFPTGAGEFLFPTTGFGFEDMDLNINGSSTALALTPEGSTWGVATTTTSFTITSSGFNVASSSVIVIRIGTNATTGINGDQQIINPTATTTSYAIDIGGTMADAGQVRVAIIDEVVVSADVNTSLSFVVSGVNAGATVNASPTTTTGTSTHVTLPFGTLPINQSRMLAQRLNVSTNATNGYSVTVEHTLDLRSGAGAIIDGFADGVFVTNPTAWQGPSADISDPKSYGHWGLTSTDGTTTRSNQFGDDLWVSGSTTPVIVMGHSGPADGITEGVGSTTVGYQVQISALQEAGDDYTTTLRYIATPVF
jgi:hypothetical protein